MSQYRPEIDGLRALAILGVLAYHAKFQRLDWFQGGFVGVDIFFVISGYLISRILLNELKATGRINFAEFYVRRTRRILPMLLFVIAVCLPFAYLKFLPIDLIEFAQSALSTLAFGSNFFFFFKTTAYGADSSLLKPLLHTWSLAVEEQFYIFLPLALVFFQRHFKNQLLSVLSTLFVISITIAIFFVIDKPELGFYLPFSRFFELLVGSLIAFIEVFHKFKGPSFLHKTMPVVGLGLIAHSFLHFNNATPHPGLYTLVPVVGTALIIAFGSTDNLICKLLSTRPLTYIGLVSYSAYLWHFPIFAFSRYGSSQPSDFDKVEWVILTSVLSLISFYLIEKPFRNHRLFSSKQLLLIFGCVSITIVSACLFIVQKNGMPSRLPPILSKTELTTDIWDSLQQNGNSCFNRKAGFCEYKTSSAEITVVDLGDSHNASVASQLVPMLQGKAHYVGANISGCPFALGVDQYSGEQKMDHCTSADQLNRLQLLRDKKNIVIIGGRFPVFLSGDFFDNEEGGEESGAWYTVKGENGQTLEEAFERTIDHLIGIDQIIILVYPIPEVGVDVPSHIFNMAKSNVDARDLAENFQLLTTSFAVYMKRSKRTFDLFDSVEHKNIYRVHPHTIFCNNQIKGRCVTHDTDDVFYNDDDHPSTKGAELIARLLLDQIDKAIVDLH